MKKFRKIIIIVVGIIIALVLGLFIYFNVIYIGKNKVKEIIIDNMEVSSSDVYFESIELETDKNYYEVEIYYQNKDYEYKIDAKEGKVIYTDFGKNGNNNDIGNVDSNESANGNIDSNNAKISSQEARNIALDHAKLDISVVKMVKCESEYDNGILVYEVDFTYDNYEYDYKVNANTGEIISFDKDNILD